MDDDLKALLKQLGQKGNSTNGNEDSGTGGVGESDYSKLLEKESYKTLLSSNIAASVARDNARKYVGASLTAGGMGTQGMSESARVGIDNNYLDTLAKAQENHGARMASIAAQREADAKAQANSDFQSLTTLMGATADLDQLNGVLSDHKITIDETGHLSGEGYAALSPSDQQQLSSLYRLYSSQYGKTPAQMISGRQEYADSTALKGKVDSSLAKGVDYITSDSNFLNKLTNGKVVCLQNEKNADKVTYLMFYNGKWYEASAEDYWGTENRELVKSK